MSQQLGEYIRLILERIRSTTFKWNEFEKLSSREEIVEYARTRLKYAGQGSSREVFYLTGRHVLKVAKNDFGVAQNEQELKVFNDHELRPFVTKITRHSPKNLWLVSEVVRPVEILEFHELLGSEYNFYSIMRAIEDEEIDGLDESAQRLGRAIEKMMNDGVYFADIKAIDHWGKTSDGRVVLLDSGYSETSGKYQ